MVGNRGKSNRYCYFIGHIARNVWPSIERHISTAGENINLDMSKKKHNEDPGS